MEWSEAFYKSVWFSFMITESLKVFPAVGFTDVACCCWKRRMLEKRNMKRSQNLIFVALVTNTKSIVCWHVCTLNDENKDDEEEELMTLKI